MTTADPRALFGEMLHLASDRVQAVCDEWLRAGKDITELVVVIGIRRDGGGAFLSKSRAEFVAAFRDVDPASANEIASGRRDLIPAAFLMVDFDVPAVHVTWIDPVSPEELQ